MWDSMQTPSTAPSTPPRPPRPGSKSNMSGSVDSNPESPTSLFFPQKSQAYMDSLQPPTPEDFQRITHIQEQNRDKLRQRDREEYQNEQRLKTPDREERARAARLIQKTFRGHRARREMDGFGIDASTRWLSALREAQFRQTTRPRSRDEEALSKARQNWKKASIVARRAGHDDLESDSSSIASENSGATPEEKEKLRHLRDKLLADRKHQAQVMGQQYWLEMVDSKHRYGSNLRMYHAEWKKLDTKENFFFWLDFGDGKNIELDACPRDRLEREKIRYLSREERQYYLAKVDNDGRLRWAKNGERIDTTEQFKDSVHGIVPVDDPTPAYDSEASWAGPSSAPPGHSRINSLSSLYSTREADRAAKYAESGAEEPTSMKRISHLSASTIWNKLLRRSVKDGTWIFVADTSFRLYVGIKNSGAFQHSSFLQGSRISAAGLIRIKDGRISSLSPLSGHYRPPASNFRAFVKSLKEGGVDMSHVTISKSYAVLVGLEVYLETRKWGQQTFKKMMHGKDKLVRPEEVKRKEEEKKDRSESAQKERERLAEAEKEENGAVVRMMKRLGMIPNGHMAEDVPGVVKGGGHGAV